MKLPLTFRDLEVGKLYTGCWLAHNEPVQEVWLGLEPATAGIFCHKIASLSCFVLLEKQKNPVREEEAICKILTNTGDVGWAVLVDGIHWFSEFTGDKS